MNEADPYLSGMVAGEIMLCSGNIQVAIESEELFVVVPEEQVLPDVVAGTLDDYGAL